MVKTCKKEEQIRNFCYAPFVQKASSFLLLMCQKHKYMVFKRDKVNSNQYNLDTYASSYTLLQGMKLNEIESPLEIPELGYQLCF